MAVDGRRTRVPYLAWARSIVAGLVVVLTVVLLVMAAIDTFRPVDLRLSILDGEMDSLSQWYTPTSTATATGGGSGSSKPAYEVAKQVNLWFILRADNPSGRRPVRCHITTALVIDMPHGFDGMTEIGAFQLPPKLQSLKLERQTSKTLLTKVTLKNADALSYIARTYGRKGTFTAMVVVGASIGNHAVTQYYCWPVSVGWNAAESDTDVTCTPAKEMTSIPSYSSQLLTAPAPAPAAGY